MSRVCCSGLASLAALACASSLTFVRAADEKPAVDPRRPAAIATENAPHVSAELFDRLNQYQNVRQASFNGWAPDGKGMLIETRFGNANQLHRVYEPGGRREQLTFFEEPTGGRFLPKSKDDILCVNSRGGDENFQISYLDPTTGRPILLTDGKSRNELGPVREDGKQMIIHSNRRNGRDTDIYVQDTRKPDSAQMLLETDGQFWVANDWSADGKQLLLLHYVSINESSLALFDIASKKKTDLKAPAEGQVSFGGAKFAPDGKTAYVTCDARGEFHELARLDLASGKYEWLTGDIPWDVDGLEVDHDSGRVAFVVNEDGASRLFLIDGKGDAKSRRELKVPLGVIAGLEFSKDGKQLGFSLARPDAPADAYSIALDGAAEGKGGELVRWTFSEVGGLDTAKFVSPSRIQFSSFDGRQIPAYVYQPPKAAKDKPVAVIINIHGGPEGQYRPLFSGLTQFYVLELGVAVICPNVRGSAGYGKTYLKLDNAELREDSVRDIGGLLDWVKTQPQLDANRIGVEGGSYGGYMVLASLTHFPQRIKAGVDHVGIANFITFLERTSPYRQDLRRVEYGDERDPKMRAKFEEINPSANAHKIASALLVAHGTNDPRVPFSEAQQIVEKVRGNGRTVWTVYADNEGHGFRKKDNRDYLSAVEVMFWEENLLK